MTYVFREYALGLQTEGILCAIINGVFIVPEQLPQVTRAIAVHGCQLSDNGTITHALEVRLDTAFQLYLQGVASTIIVCGWYPLKREDLAGYCEAELMEEYLCQTYGAHPAFKYLTILQERDSTSVPENLVFVRDRFPNLQEVTIIVGEKVIPRIEFFAWMVFDGFARVHCYGCDDGVSNEALERKLIGDAKCTLSGVMSGDSGMTPGVISYLLLPPTQDGRRQSRWDQLRVLHHGCPWYKLGYHPE